MKTKQKDKTHVCFSGVRRMVAVIYLLAVLLLYILTRQYFKINTGHSVHPQWINLVFNESAVIYHVHPLTNLLTNGSKNTTGTYTADSEKVLWQQQNLPDPCSNPRRNTGIEDILCMKPPEFLSNFKNPCWYDKDILRCLPYFHLIGVCKSGTSDFFRRLYLHPDIVPNRGIFGKETWYWSWKRLQTKKVGSILLPQMTLQDFTNQFRSDIIFDRKTHTSGSTVYHPAVTGHGDPMDFWDRFDWKNTPQNDPAAEEPLWTTPSAVRHINPDVKLILLIRDPVERLYSHFFHGGFGKSSADFSKKAINALKIWDDCIQNRTFRACAYDRVIKDRMQFPLYTSLYPIHLYEWLKVFPRSQLHVIRTEDYVKDIKGTMSKVFKYLKLDQPAKSVIDKMEKLPVFYATQSKVLAGGMDPHTRTLLNSFFKPYMLEFSKMLGDSIFTWTDVRS